MNYDLISCKSDVPRYKTFINSLNLSFCPLQPTHHTETSESLIDHIVVSDIKKVTNVGQISVPGISKHDLLYLTYDMKCYKHINRIINRRDLKNINDSALYVDTNSMPWYLVYCAQTVDQKVDIFNKFIHLIYNKHAP